MIMMPRALKVDKQTRLFIEMNRLNMNGTIQQHITYRTLIERFGPQPQPSLWLCGLL